MRYRCSDNAFDENNTIAFTSLCDGIQDCFFGDDETNIICDGNWESVATLGVELRWSGWTFKPNTQVWVSEVLK